MGEFSFWQVDRHEIAKDFPITLLAECGQAGQNMFKMDKKWYFKFFKKFLWLFTRKVSMLSPVNYMSGLIVHDQWNCKILTSNMSTKDWLLI